MIDRLWSDQIKSEIGLGIGGRTLLGEGRVRPLKAIGETGGRLTPLGNKSVEAFEAIHEHAWDYWDEQFYLVDAL